MKLSRLYSNKPDLLSPINFNSGLNVVYAEIRRPENKKKDTHNLGKTTLGRLLDFCFLSKKDKGFFLFKHFDLFEDFIFFLEIELFDGSFLTISRQVKYPSKISFKKHNNPHQDFSGLENSEWNHFELPFEKSQKLLDSYLDWVALKPWNFRKGLGYQLRSQDDYRDVAQLGKFAGVHSDWKPFLAHILGFDHKSIALHYEVEKELEETIKQEGIIKSELGGSIDDISTIEGLLLLNQKESEKKQTLLDAFDFREHDKEETKNLVDEIDIQIGQYNEERYSLNHNLKKILNSLEDDQILFKPEEAQRLFAEAGVLFKGQIKKDFEQLIAFNKAITDERRQYLKEEYKEIEAKLRVINTELTDLGEKRSQMLSYLGETDIFNKYKQVSNELIKLRAEVTSLEYKRDFLSQLQGLRTKKRLLTETCNQLQGKVEDNVVRQNSEETSLFSKIRIYFNEIIESVIGRKALLNVSTNKEGHLEFKAEILDESGRATSADLGHTYRKLLCISFDMAILRGHLNVRFPRFVFHDGIFESLDNRKKTNLLKVIREYANFGIQPILTLIDSDLPPKIEADEPIFEQDEIILTLHDEDNSGRLFKMNPW